MTVIPRYAPEFPFPPYSYVSGQWPHPLRDPQGHSFGMTHTPVVLPDQSQWQQCREYCYAVDLWNAGYYWEAHEHWESLWNAAGRHGPTADFFKALIKLAAAGVKAREGRPEGVQRHLTRAFQLWQQVFAQFTLESGWTQDARYWGLMWRELLETHQTILQALNPSVMKHDTTKQPVVRMWEVQLKLA